MRGIISLYKVLPDVEYIGHYMSFIKPSELNLEHIQKVENDLGCPSDDETLINAWFDNQDKMSWSDNRIHELLDWTEFRKCYRHLRGWSRMEQKIAKYGLKTFHAFWQKIKYLVVEDIESYRTNIFSKRFARKEIPFAICTTPEEVRKFFDKNTDNSKIANEIRNNILNKWSDNCLLFIEI